MIQDRITLQTTNEINELKLLLYLVYIIAESVPISIQKGLHCAYFVLLENFIMWSFTKKNPLRIRVGN